MANFNTTIGDDVFVGPNTNDLIFGSPGTDSIDGGGGTDRLVFLMFDRNYFALPSGSRTYTIGNGFVTDSSGTINTSFSSIERVNIRTDNNGDFGDTIDASGFVTNPNLGVVVVLTLGDGNDTVIGSNYSDDIYLGLGVNVCDAGAGINDNVRAFSDNRLGVTQYVTSSGNAVITTENGIVTNTVTNAEYVWVGGMYAYNNSAVPAGLADGLTTRVDASGYTPIAGVQLIFTDHNGTDIFIGSPGNDLFGSTTNYTAAGDTLTGGGGDDEFEWQASVNACNGDVITDFNAGDRLNFQFNTSGANLVTQFLGSGVFTGVAGQFRYQFANGNTLVQFDVNGDKVVDYTLTLNGYHTLVETAAGSKILVEGSANVVPGSPGADTLFGTAGDDIFTAGSGNDRIIVSTGNDIVHGDGNTDRLVVNMQDATSFAAASGSRTFLFTDDRLSEGSTGINTVFDGIERATFTMSNDNFGHTIDASAITAISIIATFYGGANAFAGGSGSDVVTVNGGAITMTGGGGQDFLQFSGVAGEQNMVVTGDDGSTVITRDGVVIGTLSGVEEIALGASSDNDGLTFYTDASGYTGSGLIYHDDHNGNDVHVGSAGRDFFVNGQGAVVGTDIFTGNGGADIYDYTYAVTGLNDDVITDFDADDQIDFRFNNGAFNTQLANHFIGSNPFSGVAGEYRYQFVNGQTEVQVDINGDKIADHVLHLTNGYHTLVETAAGSNILVEGTANIVTGTPNPDTLTGTAGDDIISALGSRDTIYATSGNDIVHGGNGAYDRLYVIMGNPAYFANTVATGPRTYVVTNDRISETQSGLNTVFDTIEYLDLTMTAADGLGHTVDTTAMTAGPAVRVTFLAGDNVYNGGGGNDFGIASWGYVTMHGGGGADALQFNAFPATSTLSVTGDDTAAILYRDGIAGATVDGVEEIFLGGGNPDLSTRYTDASGYTGSAMVYHGDNAGDDIALGSAGRDFFVNLAHITTGHDTYNGNGGADIYDYTYAVDALNDDHILDFDADDVIDFRFNDGGAYLPANIWIGNAAFSGHAGEYRYEIVGDKTQVQVDSDGNGVADHILYIDNGAFTVKETSAGSNMLTLDGFAQTYSGTVADGYIQGGTLFVDMDNDGIKDDGEAFVTTDANGHFSITVNKGATLAVTGGTNADTGLANLVTLRAPIQATIVNPLTTLVAAVMMADGALSVDQAQDKVAASLGIDTSLDLLTYDPLAHAGDAAALTAQKAAAMVVNLLAAAQDLGSGGHASETQLLSALAQLVAGGTSVDLTDAQTVTSLYQSTFAGDPDAASAAATVASQNDGIADATSLAQVSQAQAEAQNENAGSIVIGTAGHDTLHGYNGDDVVKGLGGRDWLYGDAGDDVLIGGDGLDHLSGGSGSDLFVAEMDATRSATKLGNLSLDVVLDFGHGDHIDLSGLEAAYGIEFHLEGSRANKDIGDLTYKIYDSVRGAEKALGIDLDGTSGPSPYSGPVTVVFGNVDGGHPDFALALFNTMGVTADQFVHHG